MAEIPNLQKKAIRSFKNLREEFPNALSNENCGMDMSGGFQQGNLSNSQAMSNSMNSGSQMTGAAMNSLQGGGGFNQSQFQNDGRMGNQMSADMMSQVGMSSQMAGNLQSSSIKLSPNGGGTRQMRQFQGGQPQMMGSPSNFSRSLPGSPLGSMRSLPQMGNQNQAMNMQMGMNAGNPNMVSNLASLQTTSQDLNDLIQEAQATQNLKLLQSLSQLKKQVDSSLQFVMNSQMSGGGNAGTMTPNGMGFASTGSNAGSMMTGSDMNMMSGGMGMNGMFSGNNAGNQMAMMSNLSANMANLNMNTNAGQNFGSMGGATGNFSGQQMTGNLQSGQNFVNQGFNTPSMMSSGSLTSNAAGLQQENEDLQRKADGYEAQIRYLMMQLNSHGLDPSNGGQGMQQINTIDGMAVMQRMNDGDMNSQRMLSDQFNQLGLNPNQEMMQQQDSNRYVGMYPIEVRKQKIMKYKDKLKRWRDAHPVNNRFEGRARVAETKPRVKGRFVKKVIAEDNKTTDDTLQSVKESSYSGEEGSQLGDSEVSKIHGDPYETNDPDTSF
eukprot:CAMPEP_0114998520 /NCGR_PEP_ID=MMETSP0216-20121206/15557_1 /TAXON_ID=223996 /ORGANISM="Protocruzia adherens, Strain Boccale" /LENGTH=549 /DNA_ID=CAMNT_0002363135 /DNA_START=35 /DNA_END=1684 /DNA_ORIENTATION=-